MTPDDFSKNSNYSLIDLTAVHRAIDQGVGEGVYVPKLPYQSPFDLENEDSDEFGVDSQETGRVLTSSFQDYFPTGIDSRNVIHKNGDDGKIDLSLFHIHDVEY